MQDVNLSLHVYIFQLQDIYLRFWEENLNCDKCNSELWAKKLQLTFLFIYLLLLLFCEKKKNCMR